MKLRTKATIFFTVLLVVVTTIIIIYAEYVVGNVFRKQTTDNFRIVAERIESTYLTFLENIKERAFDWASGPTLRDLAKTVIDARPGTPERAHAANEFAKYVTDKKIPFTINKTIFLVDLLDQNGIVIASTRPDRVGTNEKEEEALSKAHSFNDAIHSSKFGEVFTRSIVIEKDESPDPMFHAMTRLFAPGKNGEFQPLNGVLLIHFSDMQQIADILKGQNYTQLQKTPNKTLLTSYQTSDIYLVNREKIVVVNARSNMGKDQKMDTLPVQECLQYGREIDSEYDNYQGVRVFGSSMCFPKDRLVLIVEVQKDEVFAPMTALIHSTIIGGTAVLFFGIFMIFFFVRRPLMRVGDIVLVAKKVSEGNLDARVTVQTKDEIGYLASVFNTMIASVRDAQQKLQISKKRDEALLASIGEGMIATDDTGKIITTNYRAERILGLNNDELVGKNIAEVTGVMDESGEMVPLEKHPMIMAIRNGSIIDTNTLQYVNKNSGKKTPLAVIVSPVILAGELIGAIAIFHDITKEKILEETRNNLLSLASHQLRTPLSGTKWLIETLQKGLHGSLTKEQAEYLSEIYKINEHMTSLVHDMLSVLRMESDSTPTRKETISLKHLVNIVFEGLGAASKNKQVALVQDQGEDCVIATGPLVLRNILEIFISNAINYSTPGSTTSVNIKKDGLGVVIAIQDTGIGIPKKELTQVFKRFYRASNARTFDPRGTGLGLYIASILAKKIGALLSFDSEEGKGSTFYVYIPYSQADNADGKNETP